MGVPEVGLEAQLALEADSTVGADVVLHLLSVGLPVEQALVSSSAMLRIEDALASGVAADVGHDPRPLGSIIALEKNFPMRAYIGG